MAFKSHSFCVGVCFFLVSFSLLASSLGYAKTRILSKHTEAILEAGDNFTVLCEGNTPLKWSWPEVEDDYRKWTSIEVQDDIPKNNTYKHASRLFLRNATFAYTGYYNCFGQATTSSDEKDVAKIYLYVRDEEHLYVENKEVLVVLATQFSNAVLPCRPTSPDVKVELQLITGDEIRTDVIGEGRTMFRYHPHFGFITNDTKTPEQILYICKFTRDSKEQDLTIILDIQRK